MRQLGLTHLICVVVASMVGAGVFTTSGYALADLGSRRMVLLAWGTGAVIALCGALTYGELARRLPQAGGEYLYITRVLHPMLGFVAGWISLTAGFTGAIALSATAMEAYLLPNAIRPYGVPRGLLATAAIAVATMVHATSVKGGARLQSVVVLVKLAALSTFALGGGLYLLVFANIPCYLDHGSPGDASTSLGAFASSLVWISLSYSGFNAAIYVAGEAKQAERLVPRSMVIATLIVSALYLGLNTVILYSAPYDALAGQPNVAAIAAESVGGHWLGLAMRIIVAVSLFTSVSAMVMSGPRVYTQMAKDGVFPEFLGVMKSSPSVAVASQGGLAALAVWLTGISELLSYLGLTLGLSTLAVAVCVLTLHAREWLAGTRNLVVAIPTLIFAAATFTTIAFAGYHRPIEITAAVITVALGSAAYGFTTHARHS